ncbi:Transcriptional regulator PerR [Planctomycetes bacterium Pan216]|uniref:Transcriptional regulator PerR n=1 Tax=Kolteria novifilia TaxID=2527975 RepID=A0A518B0Q1_9BACT|nr:Transcriptional regulator PerR [Planctomycetes bacterium Pan216]
MGSERHVDSCEELFRACGMPLTIQRRIIFEELSQRSDHPTADQIFQSVQDRLPGLSRTTVYRVLEALVEAGLIQRICHPGATARYDANMNRHHHVVCLKCQRVIDLHSSELDALAVPKGLDGSFRVLDVSVHFRGLCAECQEKQDTANLA